MTRFTLHCVSPIGTRIDLDDCFDNVEQATAEATLVLEELVSGDPISSPIGLIEVRNQKGDCVSMVRFPDLLADDS